jgi:AraC family transcriptional regulator of arabinose operon
MPRHPVELLAGPWPEEPLAPRPRLAHLALVEPRAPFAWEEHRHDDHEVIVVERGTYRCRLNGADLRFGAGMLLAVKPGDRHQDFVAPSVRYLGLGFTLADARGRPTSLLDPAVAPERQIGRDRDGAVLGALRRLQQAGTIGRHARGIARAALEEAMWRIAVALPPDSLARPFRDDPEDRAFAERLAAVFRERLADGASVAELAAAMRMSASALTQRCRAALGASPVRALAAFRMDHASALLHSGMRVKEVAEALGYADQFHFSRAFKRRHGKAPSLLR